MLTLQQPTLRSALGARKSHHFESTKLRDASCANLVNQGSTAACNAHRVDELHKRKYGKCKEHENEAQLETQIDSLLDGLLAPSSRARLYAAN